MLAAGGSSGKDASACFLAFTETMLHTTNNWFSFSQTFYLNEMATHAMGLLLNCPTGWPFCLIDVSSVIALQNMNVSWTLKGVELVTWRLHGPNQCCRDWPVHKIPKMGDSVSFGYRFCVMTFCFCVWGQSSLVKQTLCSSGNKS